MVRIALKSQKITSQEESNEPNNSRLEAIAHKQMCLNSPLPKPPKSNVFTTTFVHSFKISFYGMNFMPSQARKLMQLWGLRSYSIIFRIYHKFRGQRIPTHVNFHGSFHSPVCHGIAFSCFRVMRMVNSHTYLNINQELVNWIILIVTCQIPITFPVNSSQD